MWPTLTGPQPKPTDKEVGYPEIEFSFQTCLRMIVLKFLQAVQTLGFMSLVQVSWSVENSLCW